MILHLWKDIPVNNLTRDPVSVAEMPIYVGFLSQVGIFFWAASVTICVFMAKVISDASDDTAFKSFFVVSGMLTLVLGLDDAFLLHEEVFPLLGVPEKVVFATYAGFTLFYLAKFHRVILTTNYILLGMAFSFFGMSVMLDLLEPDGINKFLFEDGAKLLAIVTWLVYFFCTGGKYIVKCFGLPN